MRAIREKYSHKTANAKKARKRTEAEVRQKARDARDARSDKDQIIKLNDGGHTAKKERAKLRTRQ